MTARCRSWTPLSGVILVYCVCIIGVCGIEDNQTVSTTAVTEIAENSLNKGEIVAIIFFPICSITVLLTAISLVFWCKKRQRQVISTKYFLDKMNSNSSTSNIDTNANDDSATEPKSTFHKLQDEEIEMVTKKCRASKGADNPNYLVESSLPEQTDEDITDNERSMSLSSPNVLVTSVELPVFDLKQLPEVELIPPSSTTVTIDMETSRSCVSHDVIEAIANQRLPPLRTSNASVANVPQVIYSHRTAL